MIDKNNIPKHIAIIMDGNGRWARERGLGRSAGHKEGVARVKEIIKAANNLGVKVVTFFTFSTENWSRPKKEIDLLMRYLNNFLEREAQELHKNNIRFRVIGGGEPLPGYIQKRIEEVELKTRENTGLVVVMALNYGARQEIVAAAKRFANALLKGEARLSDLDVDKFSNYFDTAGLPDPDLLIRTSGQMRLSNFLLWQLSYTELYFPREYWPDFRTADLEKAIKVYQIRERRFGGL